MNDNKMTSDPMDDWGWVTTSVQLKCSVSVSTEIVPRDVSSRKSYENKPSL